MFRIDPLANVEPLIRRVYAYAAYRVGEGADAEDVTSDTFERALRHRKSYDPSKGEPIAWLLGIARRCISESLGTPRATGEEFSESPAPGDLEEDTVRRLDVVTAVRVLSERERELIALRYGADLTALQIGEVLGLRTNAVEVALHRALGRLREVVDEAGSNSAESSASATAL